MTRSSIWLGIGFFILALMGTVSTDPSARDIGLSRISLAGSPALADRRGRGDGPRIELPNPLDVADALEINVDSADDDGDDDEGPDDDGGDDN
jgi:hypothetical protein